jgi:hypothetical protein
VPVIRTQPRNLGVHTLAIAGAQRRVNKLIQSGLDWLLAGTIRAGQSSTFLRNAQGMSLNNAGDEIVLIDAGQTEHDRFSYTSATEGTVIKTLH